MESGLFTPRWGRISLNHPAKRNLDYKNYYMFGYYSPWLDLVLSIFVGSLTYKKHSNSSKI